MTALSLSRARRLRRTAWGLAALMLMAPALAMLLTREVAWGPGDFLAFGGLLLLACGGFELVLRRAVSLRAALTGGVLVAFLFLLAWAELAVGLLGPG